MATFVLPVELAARVERLRTDFDAVTSDWMALGEMSEAERDEVRGQIRDALARGDVPAIEGWCSTYGELADELRRKQRAGAMREAMPEIAAFVDALRDRGLIDNATLARALRNGDAWMQEGGHYVGLPGAREQCERVRAERAVRVADMALACDAKPPRQAGARG